MTVDSTIFDASPTPSTEWLEGAQHYEGLIDRMEALCKSINYNRKQCQNLVDDFLMKEGYDGSSLTIAQVAKVNAIITNMEAKAANVKPEAPKEKPQAPATGPDLGHPKQNPFKVGDFVKLEKNPCSQFNHRFGIIESISEKLQPRVLIGDGSIHEFPLKKLSHSCAEDLLRDIQWLAADYDVDETTLFTHHGAIANGRDKLSFAVLSELHERVITLAEQKAATKEPTWLGRWVEYDKKGIEVRSSKRDVYRRLTYKQLDKEMASALKIGDTELHDFMLFLVAKSDPSSLGGGGTIAGPGWNCPDDVRLKAEQMGVKMFSDEIVDRFIASVPQKTAGARSRSSSAGGTSSQVPADAQAPSKPAQVAPFDGSTIYGAIEDAKTQTTPQMPESEAEAAYEGAWNTIEETARQESNDIFAACGVDLSSIEPPKEPAFDIKLWQQETFGKAHASLEKAQTAVDQALKIYGDTVVDQQFVLDAAYPETPEQLVARMLERGKEMAEHLSMPPVMPPIRTEAGLMDPTTGELLEESLILRKFGWTEMPKLSLDASEFELQEFESKIDQIADKILGHAERTTRWRGSCEKRCEPFDKAAEFWANFMEPLAKQLAAFRLPRFKSGARKGEFSQKTMWLQSGGISFTQSGGFYQHDPELVKKHIEEQGVEKFAELIGAKATVTYSYDKLISALKKGTLKDIPGTGHRQVNPLAKVKVVAPRAAGGAQHEEDEHEGG